MSSLQTRPHRSLTNMAVEEPHARVISLKPHDKVARRPDHQGISTHRDRRKSCVVARVIYAPIIIRSYDHLEIVAVKMERMFPRVGIIEDDFDNLVLLQDEAVGVTAVYCHIRCIGACGERGVQRRYNRPGGCNVIEECTTLISTSHSSNINGQRTSWRHLQGCPTDRRWESQRKSWHGYRCTTNHFQVEVE